MRRLAATVLGLSALLAAIVPATAAAEFGFAGAPEVRALDASDQPFSQAGGHPDRVTVSFELKTKPGEYNGNPQPVADGNVRDLVIDLPPGLAGDPLAVPTCPRRLFDEFQPACPVASRVGIVRLRLIGNTGVTEGGLFNIEPAPGRLAEFGMSLFGKTVLVMRVRADDYGLRIEQVDIPQGIPMEKMEVELWGVPADHEEEAATPRRPFLTLPTSCDAGPLRVAIRARSWQQPERWVSVAGSTGTPLSGCEGVPYAPSISFGLSDRATDSPSGVSLDLTLPQNGDPDGRASAATEEVSVAFPPGLALSPGIASGLTLCPDAALALGSEAPASCPPSSRVGTVELEGSPLRERLNGRVFLGQSRPGERFRLFVVAEGSGVRAKVVGTLRTDPAFGQVTVTLRDLPELSIGRIGLRFDGGPQALLATPLVCGSISAAATFVRHGDERAVGASDAESVDHGPGAAPCALPLRFAPSFSAGTTGNRAGRPAGLTLTLGRESGDQLVDRFAATFPPGLSAGLGSLATCGAAAAVAGRCGPESRVGSMVAEVGSGANVAALRGDIHLTGPYRRAPFGLALVLPGALGPFDLGTIVARSALRLDPASGQISVESDSLPRIIDGIPIRFRTIGLDIDRPGFIRTPTSCAPLSVEGAIRSVSGGLASVSTPYAVRGCERLRFAPALAMRFTGARSELRRGGRPGLRIGIRARPGGANLRGADIALPASLQQSGVARQAICARQDAREGRCPGSTRIGRASVETPLIRDSLSGSIHVVQPRGDGPPELWTYVDAEGVSFELRSRLLIRDGRVHTRLVGLPDVPIDELALNLQGGTKGLVSFAANPCSRRDRKSRAGVAFEGQNRAYVISREKIDRPGCAA